MTTLVSGIQPSGKLHLGNYLGALQQWLDLQNKYNCYFFLADLHAITVPYEADNLRHDTFELAAQYLALGLDPEKAVIFRQSDISAHSELQWLFSTQASLGELYRMTQFKDKSVKGEAEASSLGLLAYPVLMAGDILLYGAEVVPVGEDQVQHLEFARTMARIMNSRFSLKLVEPKPLLVEAGARVRSLLEPDKKMSKSMGDSHCLYLLDTPEEATKKIMRATTDEGGKEIKHLSAGVENLFTIWAGAGGNSDKMTEMKEAALVGTLKYSELKLAVAKDVSAWLENFQTKYNSLIKDEAKVQAVLTAGAAKAKVVAEKTLSEVKEKMGF